MSNEITVGSGRTASPPSVGALRDALRTILGFVVVWVLTKVIGAQAAADLSPQIEAVIVIAVSAGLAWFGKRSRNSATPVVGKVV